MAFLKGKPEVCSDVCTEADTETQVKWHGWRRWQLTVATEEPELKGPQKDIKEAGAADGSHGDFMGQQGEAGTSWIRAGTARRK